MRLFLFPGVLLPLTQRRRCDMPTAAASRKACTPPRQPSYLAAYTRNQRDGSLQSRLCEKGDSRHDNRTVPSCGS